MWNDQEEESKEATWEESSQLYRDFHRQLTVSEYDRPHKSVVFCQEQTVAPLNGNSANGSSSTSNSGDQINFISQFTIVSHQGTHTHTHIRKRKPPSVRKYLRG